MALHLLCSRPLFRQLDLESARFVVSKWIGLTVNGKHLEFGEEVPRGVLTRYVLECEYERPLARIDELGYALTVDGLREAVVAHGVTEVPVPAPDRPDLGTLDRQGLARLCEQYGLKAAGPERVLRQRLEAHLAGE